MTQVERVDFTPDNVEIWIDNWKRHDVIGNVVCRSWLESYPFERINVIVNHSSVTINDFPEDIRPKIKLWPNVMRHDLSRGPITKNINQAYVHTFLAGKKYCIVAHDSYTAKPGWHECIVKTWHDLYIAPQGDGFHVQTLDGLRTFGWWDERYATMGWHEIDYIARAVRKASFPQMGILDGTNPQSLSAVDIHRLWPNDFPGAVRENRLFFNSVGLENFIQRLSTGQHPQIGERSHPTFTTAAEEWHRLKWGQGFDTPAATMQSLLKGPYVQEINWYPWLDLNSLRADGTAY